MTLILFILLLIICFRRGISLFILVSGVCEIISFIEVIAREFKRNHPRMPVFICKIVFTHALRTLYARSAVCLLASYPDSGLRQVCPHGDLLPGAHVRVAVPLESGFQLLQLLAGEVSPLPPLLLLLGVVRVPVIAPVLSTPLLFCGSLKSVELLHVTATFIWL